MIEIRSQRGSSLELKFRFPDTGQPGYRVVAANVDEACAALRHHFASGGAWEREGHTRAAHGACPLCRLTLEEQAKERPHARGYTGPG